MGRVVRFEPLTPVRDQLERSKDLLDIGERLLNASRSLNGLAFSLRNAGNVVIACASADGDFDFLDDVEASADSVLRVAEGIKQLVAILRAGGLQ